MTTIEPAQKIDIETPVKPENAEVLHFFRPTGELALLSNFSSSPFTINGVRWDTVEHYYQAQKFMGTDMENAIRACEDPADAKKLGKQHESESRPDWDAIKEDVMFAGLLAKFSQNMAAAKVLLGTKNAYLVEHSKKDTYWGDGHGSHGLNRLGILMMKVRAMIRSQLGEVNTDTQHGASGDAMEANDTRFLTAAEKKKIAKENAAIEKMMELLLKKSEAIDEGIISTSRAKSYVPRQLRTRPGTASKPYRTIDGTPLFEKDAETGQISVIDSDGLLISPKSLTPAARTVTFLYQFEKRNRREANQLEPEELEEDEETDEDYDYETEAMYAPPPEKPSLDDIINERAILQLLEESELAIVMALSMENDRESADFKALAIQLRTLSSELQKHINTPVSEQILDNILQSISKIEALVGSSSS